MNAPSKVTSLVERQAEAGGRNDAALAAAFLEVGTALADMVQLLERKSQDNTAAIEVSTVLADILQLLEKQVPQAAATIAEALRSIRVDASTPPELKMPEFRFPDMPAPVVNVTVPEFKMPAPVVNIERSGKKVNLTITPIRGVNGMATSYTITEN